jgi:hypothetical protein
MLKNVDKIAWDETFGSYGPVPEMPQILNKLACADPIASHEALIWIGNQLEHQGTRWQATAITVPFLVDILASSKTHHRADLVWLLLGLAIDETVPLLPEGFAPEVAFAEAKNVSYDPRRLISILKRGDFELLDDRMAGRWHYEAYEAVERGTEVFMQLTTDADPDIRSSAVRALGWFPNLAHRSHPFVRRAATVEEDRHVLGISIMMLGLIGRYIGTRDDVSWIEGRISAEHPLIVRRCAALALGTLLGTALPDDALHLLIDATEDQPTIAVDATNMSWRGCSLLGYFWRVLHSLGL